MTIPDLVHYYDQKLGKMTLLKQDQRSRVIAFQKIPFFRRPSLPLKYILILPTVITLLAVTIFPLLFSLNLSFHEWDLKTPVGARFIGLANFIAIVNDPVFWVSMKVTFVFTFCVVSLQFLLGLGLALLFTKEIIGKNVWRSIIFLPMMATPVAVGATWKYMFHSFFGIINYFLSLVNVSGLDWLGNPSLALFSIMIVDTWQWTPFMFLILHAGLESIPREPFEAAKVEGASRWQVLRYITLPLLRHAALIALVVRTMDAFKVYDLVFLLTRGGPSYITETLSIYTFRYGFRFARIGYAAALSYVMLFIIIAISRIYIRVLKRAS